MSERKTPERARNVDHGGMPDGPQGQDSFPRLSAAGRLPRGKGERTSRRRQAAGPLSAAQRELVTRNLGLVALHIRKRVVGPRRRLSPDEYADLFQTGCLGLIEAARQYRPERGIAFAAYALARIRTAIHTALLSGGLVYVPRARKGRRARGDGERASSGALPRAKGDRRPGPTPVDRPRILPLCIEPAAPQDDDATQPDEAETCGRDRVGDLIRARLQAALDLALQVELRRKHPAPSAALVRFVVAERLAVPEPGERASFRQIAERFGVSISGVLQLERRLLTTVRRQLLGDRQFLLLRRWARELEGGERSALDEAMVSRLRAAAAEHFWTRLAQLGRDSREELLRRLVREAGGAAVRGVFATLPAERADVVLTEALLAA